MQYSHLKLGSFSQNLREIERGGIKKISRIFFCLNFFFLIFPTFVTGHESIFERTSILAI